MSPEEIAGIKKAFSESLEPMISELRAIHGSWTSTDACCAVSTAV